MWYMDGWIEYLTSYNGGRAAKGLCSLDPHRKRIDDAEMDEWRPNNKKGIR